MGIVTSATRFTGSAAPVIAGVHSARKFRRTSAIGNSHCGACLAASLASIRCRRFGCNAIASYALLEWRPVVEPALEPGYIVPAPELATDGAESADELEAHVAMQPDAGVIRQRDAGISVAE